MAYKKRPPKQWLLGAKDVTPEQAKAAKALATFWEPDGRPADPLHKRPLAERLKDPDVQTFHAELIEYRRRHPPQPKKKRKKRRLGELWVGKIEL